MIISKNKLRRIIREELDIHTKVYRPWGFYDSIESGDGFQVKKIQVNRHPPLQRSKVHLIKFK